MTTNLDGKVTVLNPVELELELNIEELEEKTAPTGVIVQGPFGGLRH